MREKLGMSQEELANKLGYKSRVTASKIEAGDYTVSAENLVVLSNIFHVPIAELVGETVLASSAKNIGTLLHRDDGLESEDVEKVLDFIGFIKLERRRQRNSQWVVKEGS